MTGSFGKKPKAANYTCIILLALQITVLPDEASGCVFGRRLYASMGAGTEPTGRSSRRPLTDGCRDAEYRSIKYNKYDVRIWWQLLAEILYALRVRAVC